MEVGLTVGGRVASTVISKLINELIEYAKDQSKMQQGLNDELARLEKALPKIQAVVNGVDQGLIKEENPPLGKWLWQLRDAADQADDVMDEIKYNYEKERAEAEKNKVNNAVTNFKTFFLRAVDNDPFLKRLKDAVKAIDVVAAGVAEFYMLVKDLVKDKKEMVKSAISSRETSSILNVESRVFGREKEKDDIIKKLFNPNFKNKVHNFGLLLIIGVGGVGKTTLVQLVYNDPTVEEHFELRIWVCVSNNFDVVLLTKKLYECIFKQKADFDNFDLIQEKIKKKLECTRFLVVFDDVWNDNNKLGWEKLIAPLKNGKSGSMMLLTTRNKAVAKLTGPNIMDLIILEGLNEYGMWDLFKECAFGGEDPKYHKELVEIGRGIVKRLKGSPLAAKTVGGILWSDLNELHWKSILESELWSLEQGHNDIMPALRLTYQYLPPHLKPCFSFCSIFPQDHIFRKKALINMWIALGMVPQSVNGIMRLEDVGSKYFDDMLSKSIFICANPMFEFKNEFVMHDLIHDVSILVSQGECLRTSTNKPVSIPNTVRHLYAHIDGSGVFNISGLKNLHTLFLYFHGYHHPKKDSLVTELLKGVKSLRLLILVAHNLSEFPESISKLLHLRYLSITSSRINTFPKSVSRLYLLETMEFFGTNQVKQADALGMLINLRHLTAPEKLLDRIAGIGRLTSLQELSFSVGKDSGLKICVISDMRELQSLTIDSIENVGSREEVIQANLKDKVNLNKLSLTWSNPNKTHLDEDVLDYLEPHPGLKELTISYDAIGRPPTWFRTQSLSKLVRLEIKGNFDHLFCLEELPLLKYIRFGNMHNIKRIIHECNLSSAINAFPSLEELSIYFMNAIEHWCLAKKPNKWMQCLRSLDVFNCPKLRVLPPLPVGVRRLCLVSVGLNALPNLWNDQSSKSESLPALDKLSIWFCKNLVSLTEGLLQNPERFVALEKLNIKGCSKLMILPPGGFNKFSSLKELIICSCPRIVSQLVQEECFLPSVLQKLSITKCGYLDTTLPKALKSVHSLVELELIECVNITHLPPKDVFQRWKTLKRLTLKKCPVLASIEGLLGLSSIEYLKIRSCRRLCTAQTQPPNTSSTMETGKTFAQEKPPLCVDEIERKDTIQLQTSDQNYQFIKFFLACSRSALVFFQSLLCTLFYLVLRMFMAKLNRSVSALPQPPSTSNIMETGKASAQEKPLLSVDDLNIDDPLLLSVEPIRSLSAVRKLTIKDCSNLHSLPELPPFLQELCMKYCCRELWMRCKKSGPDWPKLSQIPKVTVIDITKNEFAMDGEYDVIFLGTGLKECILSSLLSIDGLKVLHMDRNDYYGGESTSLNLTQLWKRFRGEDKPPAHLESSTEYNVDMIPKFMMANGTLVRVLIHTDVAKNLSFKAVDGSYVFNKGKVHHVPATDKMVLESSLMSLSEKGRAHNFFIYVQNYEESDPNTHKGLDLTTITTKEFISKYGLDDNTIDFIGHALALHKDDRYLHEPALDTVKRMKLYAESLARLQGGSPYIYPLHSFGESLADDFRNLSAEKRGTYMLNNPGCTVEFDMEGKACGVTWEGETFKCKKVVCDPSYLPNKVRKVGKVARAIAIMSHPIPNTDESHSLQVIFPQKQLGRKSDMYLFCYSYSHYVAPKGKFIAFVSCEAETDNPQLELKPVVDLLGQVDEIFFETYDRYEPVNEPTLDNCFISASYDATTHFESTEMDVLSMYTLITGKTLDLPVDLSAASAAKVSLLKNILKI